jgi:hypothetical protein
MSWLWVCALLLAISLVLSEIWGMARMPWARVRRATAENFMLMNWGWSFNRRALSVVSIVRIGVPSEVVG